MKLKKQSKKTKKSPKKAAPSVKRHNTNYKFGGLKKVNVYVAAPVRS